MTQIRIIEKYSFSHCYYIQKIAFSTCLEEIREGAFQYCVGIKNITFEKESQLKTIGSRAFKSCRCLEKIQFPPLLETIGESAFGECYSIKVYDLSKTKVRYIGKNDFTFTTKISLPSTVDPMCVINNCMDYQLAVDASHPFVKYEGQYYCFNRIIFNGNMDLRHVLIRKSVERIARYCFVRLNLVSITIPSSVIEICEN